MFLKYWLSEITVCNQFDYLFFCDYLLWFYHYILSLTSSSFFVQSWKMEEHRDQAVVSMLLSSFPLSPSLGTWLCGTVFFMWVKFGGRGLLLFVTVKSHELFILDQNNIIMLYFSTSYDNSRTSITMVRRSILLRFPVARLTRIMPRAYDTKNLMFNILLWKCKGVKSKNGFTKP